MADLQDGGMDLVTARAKVVTLTATIGAMTPLEQYEAGLDTSEIGEELRRAVRRVATLDAYVQSGRQHV